MVLIPCRLWVQPGRRHQSRYQRLPGEDSGVPPAGITALDPGNPLSGGPQPLPTPRELLLGRAAGVGRGRAKGVVQPLGPGLTGFTPA